MLKVVHLSRLIDKTGLPYIRGGSKDNVGHQRATASTGIPRTVLDIVDSHLDLTGEMSSTFSVLVRL